MEMEANPAAIARAMSARDENPSARGLLTKIRSAAKKVIAKILKKNQPSCSNLAPLQPTLPVVAVQVGAAEEEDISRFTQSTAPSMKTMNQKRGLRDPILKMISEQKLGKSVLNVGVPTVIAVLVSGSSPKTPTVFMHIMVSGVSIGCVAIWIGIVLREAFPRQACISEHSGIALALICLNGLVGSYLPREFIWLPILCGGGCLLPFVIMILP